MSRGKKLDLQIGTDFDEGWQQVDEAEAPTQAEILDPSRHRLVFKKEKRRGKPVTLTGPFCLEKPVAQALLKQLKKQLGCGGTYKAPWMEFQGEIKAKLRPLLSAAGYGLKSRS